MQPSPVNQAVDSGNGGKSSELTSALLQVNKLLYKIPPSLSIASQRRYVDVYPQQRSYQNGETIVATFSSGTQFVDMKRSYLILDVKASGGTGSTICDFGTGSVANIFEEIRVKSRSGVELTRLQGANVLIYHMQRWMCSKETINSTLQAQGYTDAITGSTDGTGTVLGSTGARFIFPMYLIPCFSGDRLIPPQLLEGAIIEIVLAQPNTAFFTVATSTADMSSPVIYTYTAPPTAPSSYTVSGLQFRLDAYDIADAFDRRIGQMAASQGLNLTYCEYYRNLIQQASTEFNYDVKKSASQALAIYVIPRLSNNYSEIFYDGMVTEKLACNYFQVNVGSTWYPNSPLSITGGPPTLQNISDLYYYTTAAWRKTNPELNPPSIDMSHFIGTAQPATGLDEKLGAVGIGSGVPATSFVKSQVSQVAGIMTNNSRACVVEIKFSQAPQDGVSRRLDNYLKHLRHCRVFLSNVVVSD